MIIYNCVRSINCGSLPGGYILYSTWNKGLWSCILSWTSTPFKFWLFKTSSLIHSVKYSHKFRGFSQLYHLNPLKNIPLLQPHSISNSFIILTKTALTLWSGPAKFWTALNVHKCTFLMATPESKVWLHSTPQLEGSWKEMLLFFSYFSLVLPESNHNKLFDVSIKKAVSSCLVSLCIPAVKRYCVSWFHCQH